MPYYTNEDDVDDFNDYDPLPYSGGYDITVTYGRSIPPSDETCYPLSSRSGDAFEYQRPVFSSDHEPAAYGDQALNTEYSSYARPKTRPGSHGGGHVEDGKKTEHGGSGSGFVRKPDSGGRTEVEYGGRPESEHGSGYGRRKDEDDKKESYGHTKYSGKDSDDEKSKMKEKKKDKDKKKDGYNSGDDEKKKYKNKDDDSCDEKKKNKNKDDDGYDEKKKNKNKDHRDDYDEKKKKKDHYHGSDDDKKKKKDDYDDKKKKKKDHYGSDDDKKKKKDHYGSDDDEKKNKKKDKHHKGHREYDD